MSQNRVFKMGGTQYGDELIHMRAVPERSNRAEGPLQDATYGHVETTSPNWLYRTEVILVVEKTTKDLFEAYVNGTLQPGLIGKNSAQIVEYDTDDEEIKRYQNAARFDGIQFTDVAQKSLGAHDFGVRVFFTSKNPIVEGAPS